ncbi:sulfatase-like hydrolase/transferase [Paenibacillus sp. USDA918EY]|uniref:sulfatase-like hydrolase/transferase n=1 Tax=Paenibacillus sp. USDA918EY TaxID=2689575 RepID=UPI001358C948|nr:sulfatase-like hydrolase/transferase [Paenibacillus sp. USDA918EY]
MSDRPLSSGCLEKPNFLVLLVDEERYPPVYENNEIQAWRKQNLITHELLKTHGLEFDRHYIGSAACCPSRATLLTGHYPSLHGVSQTDGIAKRAADPDMFWLDRNTVPTLGDYFRAAGYQTYFKGKWHVSFEDIVVPGTHGSVASYHPLTGVPDQNAALYNRADRLNDFGFSSWVGPEPHGKNPRNSGSSAGYGISGRDEVYAAEATGLIEALDHQKRNNPDANPWLIVASFVNPHDIALYGAITAGLPFFRFDVEPMPDVPPPPSFYEDLRTKPRCQASYRDIYPRALQPITDQPFYRKLYYQLQKNADRQMRKVFEALVRSSFYDDTIVIFTSDHGDLLGAHGRLHQKFYCAYEEMLHVPLIIHNRRLFPRHRHFHSLTSHVDLLPTMLGLARADIDGIRCKLQGRFTEARPFVGRNLTPFLHGAHTYGVDETIYFMTEDDVTKGQNQVNPLGEPYPSVTQPNHIETVVTPIYRNQKRELWKFSRYYDDARFGNHPGAKNDTAQPMTYANDERKGSFAAPTKTPPVPDEYELYNLTEDPSETVNLAHPSRATPYTAAIQALMMKLLNEQRINKRLYPFSSPMQ